MNEQFFHPLFQGETVEWRIALGDNRKVIGDFACYVVAWLGIRQR